jgi:hypothetical protein
MKSGLQRVAAFGGLYAGYVVFLHAVDGPWRHWKDGREGEAVDLWLVQHLLWGAIAQRMGLSPKQLFMLGTVNELVEFGVRKLRPDLLWGSPESGANVALDLIGNIAGWLIAEGASRAGMLGPRP